MPGGAGGGHAGGFSGGGAGGGHAGGFSGGSGFSSGSFGNSSNGSFHHNNDMNNINNNNGFYGRDGGFYGRGGGFFGRGGGFFGRDRGSSGRGCGCSALVAVIIACVLAVISLFSGAFSSLYNKISNHLGNRHSGTDVIESVEFSDYEYTEVDDWYEDETSGDLEFFFEGEYLHVSESDIFSGEECENIEKALSEYELSKGVPVTIEFVPEIYGYDRLDNQAVLEEIIYGRYEELFGDDEGQILFVYIHNENADDCCYCYGYDAIEVLGEYEYDRIVSVVNGTYSSASSFANSLCDCFGD